MNHDTLLFVYGTLRSELRPVRVQPLLAGAHSLGTATVSGRLFDLGPYPGVILDVTAPPVTGELLQIDADQLAALDRYEGPEYRRVLATIHQSNGSEYRAWIYEYVRPLSAYPIVPHGDYVRWREEQQAQER